MIALPSGEALRRAAELCEFCPRMCRFACPVSEAAAREAFTPWGKVSLASLTAALSRAPEASAAEAFHACTGCLRCQHYCAHGNDVPSLLFAARAVAVRAGVGPRALGDIVRQFPDANAKAALRAIAAEAAGAEKAVAFLVTGEAALKKGGAVVRDALLAARALGAPLALTSEDALCCGLPLLEAGHPDEFAAHALRSRASLPGASGQPVHLVFLEASCARTVRERWPAHGAALPAGSTAEHITTFLARALAGKPEVAARPKLAGPVAFHDPCELARGLGETGAPRALLAAAVEGGSREAVRCGKDASCCGAGGLVPRVFPEVAAQIAAERREELAAAAPTAVTASPSCGEALGAADVVSLVARWLA
jgi:Fe-S oxidoreductase